MRTTGCWRRWAGARACAPSSSRRRAATAARTRSARSCSTRSPRCGPKSCSRCTSSTAPSSTSRAPSTSATRSARTRRYEKWGRQEILGDYVRLIRTIRPDIVIAMRPDGQGGGQHHQASAVISREAFLAAGDPAKFPEQIREGLRPWQPKKFYYTGRFGFPGEPPPPSGAKLTAVDTAGYDPLLGESYAEIGSRARSNHKTQGMAQLLSLPGPSSAGYQLVESAIPGQKEKGDASLFDGIDTSVPGLARHVPGDAPAGADCRARRHRRRRGRGQRARRVGRAGGRRGAARRRGCRRCARCGRSSGLGAHGDPGRCALRDRHAAERKEQQFVDAMLAAGGIRLEALADDGLVVAGQPVKLTLIAANRGASAVAVKDILFRGLDGEAGVCKPGQVAAAGVYRCEAALQVSKQARLTAPVLEAAAGRGAVRRSSRTRRSACRSGPRRSASSSTSRSAAPTIHRRARPCSIATRATSSAARSGWSCSGAAPGGDADARDRDPAGSAAAGRPRGPAGRELRVTVINGSKGPARARWRSRCRPAGRSTPPTARRDARARGRGRARCASR